MPFGKYKGVEIKKINNSYLRWLLTIAGLPDDVREAASEKIKNSDFDQTDIQITRHALDMFSKRFLSRWEDRDIGLATFVARMAVKALKEGIEIKDNRKLERGLEILYENIIWVFNWPPEAPDYKSLITVMASGKKARKGVFGS